MYGGSDSLTIVLTSLFKSETSIIQPSTSTNRGFKFSDYPFGLEFILTLSSQQNCLFEDNQSSTITSNVKVFDNEFIIQCGNEDGTNSGIVNPQTGILFLKTFFATHLKTILYQLRTKELPPFLNKKILHILHQVGT